ncbi:MAG: hypothetical protein EP348_06005 [Alphaproteobacteria bacterium]|nr:MAG: hypothetical protein EP348_06005 [Alphaproteobacteria bacterium]
MPRSVNSQITDAITQTNLINLGIAPSHSLGTLYQTTSQAVGAAMQNAVANQQNIYSLGLASLAQNLQSILSMSSATAGRTTAGLLSGGTPPAAFYRQSYPPAAPSAAHSQASSPAARPAANRSAVKP